jgi:predicted ATPase
LIRAQSIQRIDGQLLSRYRFRHILVQRYLYSSLDEVERVHLHEQVGTALEGLYSAQDKVAVVAVQLARHFQVARITEKAVHYLLKAGERAVQMSAHQEAIVHLTRGLALLLTLPDSPERAKQELALQIALGMAWTGIPGPEWENACTRALELCRQTGETSQLCRVLGGLSIIYYVRAEHHKAREFGEQALNLAQDAEDPMLAVIGHWYMGFISFSLGEYATARDHLEWIIDFYNPEQHHRSLVFLCGVDAGLSALAYAACCLWCLGSPDQALNRSQQTLALARELGHPFTLGDVLSYAGCMFNAMRRDAGALKEDAEELLRLSQEKVPAWMGAAIRYQGEALAMLGQVQEGTTQIRQGLANSQSIGVRLNLSGTLRALARTQAKKGQLKRGLTTLDEALALVEETDERHWEAELYRLRGELLLMQGDRVGAEASFEKAIQIARQQHAKSWELLATTELARLLQDQGRTDEARRRLGGIYSWFTEGFETPDLKEAKALLEELT